MMHADSGHHSFFAQYCPSWAWPYVQLARLDRPIGWWLLLLPCWWSSILACLALHRLPDFLHLGLFIIGAIAMRGAGSTWNDILDRKIDAQVERTRSRPLASGMISVRKAVYFLAVQGCVGLLTLLCFNGFTIRLGLLSLIPVLIYPLMKRITNYPQIILGFAFAWGALIGWAAEFGTLGGTPVLLYCATILWVVGYDTIYALQDIEDDSLIGIGSTAIAYGQNVPFFIGLCYLGVVWLILVGLLISRLAGFFTVLGVLGFSLHLIWQIRNIKLSEPQTALNLFKSNRIAGLLLFSGFLAQSVLNFYSNLP